MAGARYFSQPAAARWDVSDVAAFRLAGPLAQVSSLGGPRAQHSGLARTRVFRGPRVLWWPSCTDMLELERAGSKAIGQTSRRSLRLGPGEAQT